MSVLPLRSRPAQGRWPMVGFGSGIDHEAPSSWLSMTYVGSCTPAFSRSVARREPSGCLSIETSHSTSPTSMARGAHSAQVFPLSSERYITCSLVGWPISGFWAFPTCRWPAVSRLFSPARNTRSGMPCRRPVGVGSDHVLPSSLDRYTAPPTGELSVMSSTSPSSSTASRGQCPTGDRTKGSDHVLPRSSLVRTSIRERVATCLSATR